MSAVLILGVCSSLADDGIYLPPPPTGPGGEDSITTSEGVRCTQSMNSSGAYVDFGVASGNLQLGQQNQNNEPQTQSAIGYARITMPLGRTPKRIDCSRLYELEIERLKAQINLLKAGVE